MKQTFHITTDAVTTTIDAESRDDAAKKFAGAEALLKNLAINGEDDLVDEIEKMGGWVKIIEM